MKNNKKKIVIIVVAILLLGCVGLTISFAYFTARSTGTSNDNVVTSGVMELTFTDGPAITGNNNMAPGDSVTKTFTVRNTGTVYAYYNLYLNEVVNKFKNEELVAF